MNSEHREPPNRIRGVSPKAVVALVRCAARNTVSRQDMRAALLVVVGALLLSLALTLSSQTAPVPVAVLSLRDGAQTEPTLEAGYATPISIVLPLSQPTTTPIGKPPTATSTATPTPQPTAIPTATPTLISPRARAAMDAIDATVEQAMQRGEFPGAVVLVSRGGEILKLSAYGYAALYADPDTRLKEPTRMREDTVFDLASVTKTFTGVAVMRLVEQGRIGLETPVSEYVPEFAANGKKSIAIRQLLTHTSGLPPGLLNGRRFTSSEERIQAVLTSELEASTGTRYIYSDLGLITLGKVVERVSGVTLDQFIAQEITRPLGMRDTTYNPPVAWLDRVATTEVQPRGERGVLRGQVHDGNAWGLGGVAGHAGLFSTARDLNTFAQMMLGRGEVNGVRILKPETAREMTRPQYLGIPQAPGGLVWELDEPWYMGKLASKRTYGHTGYTGTSIVIDSEREVVVILLTNRLHPVDQHTNLAGSRQRIATLGLELAEALK